MKRIPYKKLESEVSRACKLAFAEMIEAYPDETYYAFALLTNGLQGLHPIANTMEELGWSVEQHGLDPKELKWAYGDWAVDDIGGEHFQQVNDVLSMIFDLEDEFDFEDANHRSWDCVENGMRKLHLEGFFGTGKKRKDIAYLLVGDMPGSLMYHFAKRLNPPSVSKQFKHWDDSCEL